MLPDFGVLLQFEMSSHAKAVLEEIEGLELIFSDPDDDTADYRSNLVMKISSLLRSERKSRRIELPTFQHKHRSVCLLFIYLSVCLFFCLFVCFSLFVCLFFFVCLFVFLFVFVCFSVRPFIVSFSISVLFIPPLSNLSGPIVEFMVVLNPLSHAAQRLIPVLSSLIHTLPVNLTVVMNPSPKLSEMPIKE